MVVLIEKLTFFKKQLKGVYCILNSFPSNFHDFQVFTHSDFKMTLSFAIDNFSPTTLKCESIPRHKNDGILSLK